MRILLLFFCCTLLINISSGQDYYFEDFVYSENIKSVKFSPYGQAADFPIVELGTRDRLLFSFDEIDDEDKRYSYKVVHCDRNWEASEIDELDYLDGFNGEEIRDSYHSNGTIIDYVHYSLILPNEYLNWTISGNYLLIISDEEGYPIITKRFLVVEPRVSVNVDYINPRKVSQLKSHQAFEISINHDDFYIRDPINELSVDVLQNFRWMDAVTHQKPKNILGYNLKFDPLKPFTFEARKEFRNFDIRSLLYTSRYVYSIRATPRKIDVLLEKERKRTYANYLTEPDANGNFVLDNQDTKYGIQSAEYVNVGFSLESPLKYDNHDVYVIGGFSDWQIYESNRMEYDSDDGLYKADIQLKQGYYDYYYALVNDDGEVDLTSLEGNWYETDNTYYILVYLREFGSYYDKLIAMYSIK